MYIIYPCMVSCQQPHIKLNVVNAVDKCFVQVYSEAVATLLAMVAA